MLYYLIYRFRQAVISLYQGFQVTKNDKSYASDDKNYVSNDKNYVLQRQKLCIATTNPMELMSIFKINLDLIVFVVSKKIFKSAYNP